jgi:hypothetical protein
MEQDAYNAALKAYIQALRDLERIDKSDGERRPHDQRDP